MKSILIRSTLAATLLLFTNLALAADVTVKTPDVKGAGAAKASVESTKTGAKAAADKTKAGAKATAVDTKNAAKAKIVDINGASEAELKAIPGIGETYATKIIANRPYTNKTQLKTRTILPAPVYEKVKDVVIAKQPVKLTAQKKKK